MIKKEEKSWLLFFQSTFHPNISPKEKKGISLLSILFLPNTQTASSLLSISINLGKEESKNVGEADMPLNIFIYIRVRQQKEFYSVRRINKINYMMLN